MRVAAAKHAHEGALGNESYGFKPCEPFAIELRRIDGEEPAIEPAEARGHDFAGDLPVFRHQRSQLVEEPARASEAVAARTALVADDPGAFGGAFQEGGEQHAAIRAEDLAVAREHAGEVVPRHGPGAAGVRSKPLRHYGRLGAHQRVTVHQAAAAV